MYITVIVKDAWCGLMMEFESLFQCFYVYFNLLLQSLVLLSTGASEAKLI
jgi:hypothetical protein